MEGRRRITSRWRLLAVALLAAACGTPAPTSPVIPSMTVPPVRSPAAEATPAGTPTPGLPEVPGRLGEALALSGPTPRELSFTDWAQIREAAGAGGLTGASPFEDKAAALRNDVPLAAFGVEYLATVATDWGFDVFDLDWEAIAEAPGTLLHVLRLRDGFDATALTWKLDEYGFATETLPRGILRSITRDQLFRLGGSTNPALMGTGLLLLNTGILDDGRTLVTSPNDADVVRAILTDGPQAVADPSLRSVARLLDGPAAAVIQVGDLCAAANQGIASVQGPLRAEIDQLLAAAGTLHPYNALGIAYAWRPELRGRIVLGYAVGADATSDLEGRRLLADRGLMIGRRARFPYREQVFTLADAHVEEGAIVLELGRPTFVLPTGSRSGPTELLPRVLLLVPQRDYLFGACSD